MKIALYIQDGLEQVVLTPESAIERSILEKIHDGSRDITLSRGAFFECRGGWVRFSGNGLSDMGTTSTDDSTMIVLRPKVEPAVKP